VGRFLNGEVPPYAYRETDHTVDYEGVCWQDLSDAPSTYPSEPPYVPAVLPTAGSMNYSRPGHSKNLCVQGYFIHEKTPTPL